MNLTMANTVNKLGLPSALGFGNEVMRFFLMLRDLTLAQWTGERRLFRLQSNFALLCDLHAFDPASHGVDA
jgi:hypothetical protein